MTNMENLRKQSDKEIVETVFAARKTLREQRFKDRGSRKASEIQGAKKTVARSLTELNARRRNQETK
jgi:ribosomal protein L29